MDRDQGIREWPDRDLVVAYKGGFPEAYDEMYRRYSDRVYNVCRRMLISPEDAREATQETFLKAYQALPRFNGQYKLGAWLSRIAANVCLDHIRRRARVGITTPLTESHEGAHLDLGPEDVVVRDAPALRTLEYIQPLHARALELRNLEGMSHKEIADQLNMSPMQVKALLHRARLSFRRAWDNASGWALAPLVGLRSILHQSSKDASSISVHLPMWTQSASPLLADRMAASALVVVVALSGTSATAPSTTTDSRNPVASAPFAGAERATAFAEPAAAPVEKKAARSIVADVTDLLAEVKDTAERETRDKKQTGKDDWQDDGSVDPGSADKASQKLVQKVHSSAKDLKDSLPHR